ncbi:MAG: archaemetzincin family Zn-dependent metalloprotease [Dehalococcoidia bacterium]
MKKIALTPIGNIDPRILEGLSQSIGATFAKAVEIETPLEEPNHAYNPRRSQYRSTAFLEAMSMAQDEERALGVCDIDLYVPRLNFVFGEADPRRKRAVISLYRLRQERYGLPRDERLFAERAAKEAIHELGHTYGLGHCGDESCVMHFSNSLPETDSKRALFCKSCAKKLKKEGVIR